MDEKKKRILCIGLVLVIVAGCFLTSVPNVSADEGRAETYPTVSVKIHRIAAVDDIDDLWGNYKADWYYYIYDPENEEWIKSAEPIATDDDDIIVDITHEFIVTTVTTTIEIYLCEDDYWTSDDLADISSYTGGGADDFSAVTRGAKYVGTYNLKTDTLTGDTTIVEGGYYKTSGDYDGSTTTDQNDANVWFDVWDNYASPTANAGSDQTVDTGDLVNFNGGSSYATGSSLTKYQWDFNTDGVYDAEGATASYTYTTKGVYTVTLKVTDSLGETDTDTCVINVQNRVPTAAFTYSPSSPTTATTIQFTDTSTDSDGTIASWSWSFGDGATSTSKDPTHKYFDDGTYTVALSVTDNDGGTDTESKQVVVLNVAPTADFTYSPTSHTTGDTIQFTDTSTDSDGSVVLWSWSFGDGYSSTEQNPTHKYTDDGTYTVTLTITDDDGANNSISMDIVVTNVAPTATANADKTTITAGETISFTGTGSDPDGSIASWSWVFGDGGTSILQNPTHQYSTVNTYTVTLTVTDDDGATATDTVTVTVNEEGVGDEDSGGEEEEKGFIPGFEAVSFLVAVGVGILLLTQKRRGL